MKSKILLIFSSLIFSLCIVSCSKEHTEIIDEENSTIESVNVQLVNNKLKFDNEESLAAFLGQAEDVNFSEKIVELNKTGFNSLRPVFDLDDDIAIDNYLATKKSRIAKKGYLYSLKDDSEEIDLEDELVSDPSFASVLNENREIYVGDNYYVYTTMGLYFCKIENEQHLKDYLSNLSSKITSRSQVSRTGCEQYYKSSMTAKDTGELSLSPVQGTVTVVDSQISVYETCGGSTGGSTGGSSGGSTGGTTTSTTIPLLIPQNFGVCAYSEDSIFQQIFGNTVKCNDYHDSDHRIQTKVWNENYLIWSSVGASAKYQKKRLIGWSESTTSDGVRLGINHAVFTYKSNVTPYNAIDPQRVIFKYKGVSYDQYGKVVTTYPINPTAWPFPQNETVGAIDIVIFGDDKYWPLTGTEANKNINKLLSQARGVIKGLSNDMTQDKVGVQITKFLEREFQIVQADILLKHSSQAKRTLDFNFLLKFKSSTTDYFQTFVNQANATKYSKIDIDIYGAALRNNVWKGKRIRGKVE